MSETHTAARVTRNIELNRFVGPPEVIDTARRLLDKKAALDDLTVRQLEKVRLRAAEAPRTIPEGLRPLVGRSDDTLSNATSTPARSPTAR